MSPRSLSVLVAAVCTVACAPDYVPPEMEAGVSSLGDVEAGGSEASASVGNSDSITDDSEEGPSECESADDCPAPRPYCDGGRCVDCSEIGHSGCLARNPERPYCDVATGRCVQCTPDLLHECEPTAPVCDAGNCRGCESSSECAAYCNEVTGQCDATALEIDVYRWDRLDEPAFDADRVEYRTDTVSSWGATGSDGHIEFTDVPYGAVFRIGTQSNQAEPISLGSVWNWLWWPRPFPAGDESKLRLPYLNKGMLGRLAYECGLFEDLEAATGVNPFGLPDEFSARATYLVELADNRRTPAPIARAQINLPFGDHVLHHGDQTELMPVFVCDVEELGELRVGVPQNDLVGTHGWFLVFGLHDPSELPTGGAGITVPGYQAVEFEADSSAGLYYLRLNPS